MVRAKLRKMKPHSCSRRGKLPVLLAVDALCSRAQVKEFRENIVQQLGGEPHDQSSTVEHLGDFCCLTSR